MSVLGMVVVLAASQAEPVENSMWFPERRGGFVSVAGDLRLALPLEPLNVGAILDASVTWYAPFPLAVRLRGSPLAVFSGGRYQTSPPGWSVAGALEVLFDTRFVAAGAGMGVATVLDEHVDANSLFYFGLVVNAFVRLGTLDGLHLTGRTHFRNLPNVGFLLSGLEGTLQVPLARGWWLRARGFGDASSIALGDAGVRIALGQDPAHAAGFLSVMAGFALSQGVFGPSVGFGYEHRFP